MTFQPEVSPRAFRSGDYRELVERALEQGFDVYRTGSDHAAVVNPLTGQRVILSTTGSTSSGHALGNVRAALVRAGLDLRSRTERRRDRRQHKKEPIMPKGQLLTEEQRTEIAERREKGEDLKDIAASMGISAKTASRHQPAEYRREPSAAVFAARRAHAVVDSEMEAKIVELREQGLSGKEVAAQLGISESSVHHHSPERLRRASRYKTIARSGPVERILPPAEAPADDEPTESVTAIVARVNQEFGEYPLIRQLVTKHNRYAKMLAEAEAIGDDDLTLVLMDKTKLTGLEAEALRLWEATQGNGGKNGNGRN